MKKLLLAGLFVFALFCLGTLVLIPNPLIVSAVVSVRVSSATVSHLVLDSSQWPKWWPEHIDGQYRVASLTSTNVRLLSGQGRDTLTSEILVLPATPDSAFVQWRTQRQVSSNPFTRLQQYRQASHIKQRFQQVLDSLAAYTGNRQRMYGMDITVARFTNPFMLNTKAEFTHYPTTDEVYASISKLRAYASIGEATAVDSPMVNIQETEGTYLLRTGLPINKKLATSSNIDFKQMVLGNTLTGVISGGQQTVLQALEQMQLFINDHRLTSPAIPFQVWQTNRQQQPDSTQWVTRLYYPIF